MMTLEGWNSAVGRVVHFFFFFQAEDGIRDYKVTGVQTCALPISQPQAAGRAHGTRRGSGVPRTRAAASRMSAMLATASAASHESHRAMLTPRAGGVIPRPRLRTRNGAARTRNPAATGDHQERARPRR